MQRILGIFLRIRTLGWGTIVKVGIILSWGVVMGLLADRTLWKPKGLRISPALAKEGLKTGEEWWGVYWKGGKIGFAVTEQTPREGKILVAERLWLKLALLGVPQNIEQTLKYVLNENLTLESFEFTLKSGLFPFRLSGRVQDGLESPRKSLLLRIQSGDREQEKEIHLPEAPFLLGQTKLYFLAQGLEPGKKYRIPAFDPASLSSAEMIAQVEGKDRLEIGGEERELYRVRQEFRGIAVKSWMDRNGQIWKEESPIGLIMVRESQQKARHQDWSPGKTIDLISLTAIPVDRQIPNPRATKFLRVRLRLADLAGLKIEGDRQTILGDEVIIKKEEFPLWSLSGKGLPDHLKEETLGPTPFIQSDHPEIRRQARAIVEGIEDPAEQMRRIAAWVYREVRKQPAVSIPSALEVLRQRVGDCNEHAVLFSALVRALGIPARLQAGIIYQEGKFFYHAWVQVYWGSWVSVDPILNQIPADATHIRLVEGDLDRQVDLVRVIGRLMVEVKEFY
jgi:hypothetical protein